MVIRPAGPDDLDAVAELELGVVRYDANFGGSIPRPATEALVRAETQAALAKTAPPPTLMTGPQGHHQPQSQQNAPQIPIGGGRSRWAAAGRA